MGELYGFTLATIVATAAGENRLGHLADFTKIGVNSSPNLKCQAISRPSFQ